MKVAVACDHGGYPLKNLVVNVIKTSDHTPIDLGTNNLDSVDFPDFARKIGEAINSGVAERGVFICGSGAGANIAANKIKGLYASVCHDVYSAHQAVEHDDMNVLCLGARIVGSALAEELVKAFLGATYWDSGNYARRVQKIHAIEKDEL